MESRFHVQGHVHGHLQRNSGDERAWFWFLSLQWMANKRSMLSFGLENASNMDFDLQLFQAFFSFGIVIWAAFRSCSCMPYVVYVTRIVLGQKFGLESMSIDVSRYDLILH